MVQIASAYSLVMLGALQRERAGHGSLRHMYAGTTPAHVVARRRARNKVARRSRRVNRCR